jgi:hypothetical protein
VSIPLRAITHAVTEFEFHISPVPSSSRPQTGVGTCATTSSTILVGGQSLRTLYGFGNVRNISAAPKPDLVAEDPKSACPPTADRALGHDAPVLAAPVVDRRLLDDVLRPWKLHLERGVVEITRRTPLQPRRDGFVHATIEPDEMPTGPKRQPVQVHCRRLTSRVAN